MQTDGVVASLKPLLRHHLIKNNQTTRQLTPRPRCEPRTSQICSCGNQPNIKFNCSKSGYQVQGEGKIVPVHVMKAHGAEVKLHSFLTSALDVRDQLHAPAAYPPPGYQLNRGLQSRSGRFWRSANVLPQEASQMNYC